MKTYFAVVFYGGPDQIVPMQTALATALAFLLIFWNKVVSSVSRIWGRLRRNSAADPQQAANSDRF
jgi:hypothetical protein